MKNWKLVLGGALLCAALCTNAQTLEDPFAVFDEIDTMMEDNALMDSADKHASIVLSFLPERATLIGFQSANDQLNFRSAKQEEAARTALNGLINSMRELDIEDFSPTRQADFRVLQARINYDIWNLSCNRLQLDPMYYALAYNSVYDLMLKRLSSEQDQNEDLAARSTALTRTGREAQANLKNPPAFLAQLAMEKAYYAYLSYDEVVRQLQNTAQDDVSQEDITATANQTRRSLKQMFEYFKTLSQAEETPDFRLGEEDYQFILQNKYFIDQSTDTLRKNLTKEFKTVRQALQEALEPFTSADGDEVVTVVGDSAVQAEKPKKKKKSKNKALPSAADFYVVRNRLALDAPTGNLLALIQREAQSAASDLIQKEILPPVKVTFSIKALPAYFAYMTPYLFVPPYGTQNNPTYDFFVRLPSGNKLNQKKMLQEDFNTPARKLMIAGELVPGRYYQSLFSQKVSPIRKRYPVPTMANGWSVYAQHLAKEGGFIATDPELLFLAWADYQRVVRALVDLNLQTRQFSYADAMTFLVQANGFEQEEAEQIIKSSVLNPGEAVSYIVGYNTLKQLRDKYQKKLRKRFSLADFHLKVLNIGNVAPKTMEKELAAAYHK